MPLLTGKFIIIYRLFFIKSKMAFSAKQAENFLNSLINYEDTPVRKRRSFRLENMRVLAGLLGIDFSGVNIIHIAGTKGKGSTALFCANILAYCGHKVGLYTSPHLRDIKERIKILYKYQSRVKEKNIPSSDFSGLLGKIKKAVKNSKKFSFFEVLTALAFKFFMQEKIKFLVLETGLGGRLDATNIADADIAVITRIGKDHTEVLGSTLLEIAKEKCGIIKKGSYVVADWPGRRVLQVLKQEAKKHKAEKLYLFTKDFKAEKTVLLPQGSVFDFKGIRSINSVKIKVKGLHQVNNACLAIQSVLALGEKKKLSISSQSLKQALKQVSLPARFEVVSKNPLIITDVSHNIDSAWALADCLKYYYPAKEYIYLFSAAKDKNIKLMAEAVPEGRWVFTRTGSLRLFKPEKLYRLAGVKNAFVEKTPAKALSRALSMYNNNSAIVVWGSFLLVSKIRSLIERRKVSL